MKGSTIEENNTEEDINTIRTNSGNVTPRTTEGRKEEGKEGGTFPIT